MIMHTVNTHTNIPKNFLVMGNTSSTETAMLAMLQISTIRVWLSSIQCSGCAQGGTLKEGSLLGVDLVVGY